MVALAFDLNPEVGPLTAAEYPAVIKSIVSGLVPGSTGTEVQTIAQEIVNEYPLSNFAVPGEALAAVVTDGLLSCMANISNELFSLSVATFGYEFNDENAPVLFPPVSFPYGATHTTELPFIFSLTPFPLRLSDSEQMLATTMKSYWTEFAKNGNPNKFGSPNWARFHLPASKVQSLIPPRPEIELDFVTEHNCGFWGGLYRQLLFYQPSAS